MVRRRNKKGGFYDEPPFTPEEEAEFYRRLAGTPIAFTRPSSTVVQSQKPQGVAPREGRSVRPSDHPIVLMSREQSTMASTWSEMLGIEQLENGKWRIGIYCHNWLGSISDLIPEDQLYDEDGELRVPTEWNGKKILGLADGEYLETEEIVSRDNGVEFDVSSLQLALAYCRERKWDKVTAFERAWNELCTVVTKRPSAWKRYYNYN